MSREEEFEIVKIPELDLRFGKEIYKTLSELSLDKDNNVPLLNSSDVPLYGYDFDNIKESICKNLQENPSNYNDFLCSPDSLIKITSKDQKKFFYIFIEFKNCALSKNNKVDNSAISRIRNKIGDTIIITPQIPELGIKELADFRNHVIYLIVYSKNKNLTYSNRVTQSMNTAFGSKIVLFGLNRYKVSDFFCDFETLTENQFRKYLKKTFNLRF